MMNLSEGRAIIRTAVEQTIGELHIGKIRPMRASLIVDQVMKQWIEDVTGPSADIALVGLHDVVWRDVRERMNADKVKEKEAPDPQLIMEGFERLQKAYVVNVDGEQTYVPIEEMTLAQIRAKAEELRGFAVGAIKHADELDRYAESRNQKAAG